MRRYVISELGPEVEVPNELLGVSHERIHHNRYPGAAF